MNNVEVKDLIRETIKEKRKGDLIYAPKIPDSRMQQHGAE